MALFVDSAKVEEVRRAVALGFVTGVTTNPALMAEAGRPGLEVLRDLLVVTAGPVFYQVTADTVAEREEQARAAAKADPGRVVVKIPATTENLTLTSRLAAEGLLCCVTAVSHPAQAYLSTLAGARYTVPYVNRLSRQLGDGIAVVRGCAAMVKGTSTRLLAASLKSADEVVAALQAGADDVTLRLDLLLALGEHPLSQRAIDDFAAAAARTV
jgi:transaldolase